MPAIQGLQPNVAPAQGEVMVAVDVVENTGDSILIAGGTQVTAEEAARAARAALHQFAIEGKILLYQDEKAIEPLAGLEKEFPGCLGYRVLLRGRMSESGGRQMRAAGDFGGGADGELVHQRDGSGHLLHDGREFSRTRQRGGAGL
jgi:hypothetical protein